MDVRHPKLDRCYIREPKNNMDKARVHDTISSKIKHNSMKVDVAVVGKNLESTSLAM